MSKMANSRHLGFSDPESFTIRSAIPENHMAELDIMSLSYIEPELCQFEFLTRWLLSAILDFVNRLIGPITMASWRS